MTQPLWRKTYTFFQRLAAFDSVDFGTIAKRCGKSVKTATAWARPPISAEHPFGSGAHTPFDCSLGLIALAHKEDPGLAREAAQMFSDYVGYLDETQGKKFIENGGSVQQLLAASLKEKADILVAMSKGDEVDWNAVKIEMAQFESAYGKFKACVEDEIRGDTPRNK